jgi:hypothetical protein
MLNPWLGHLSVGALEPRCSVLDCAALDACLIKTSSFFPNYPLSPMVLAFSQTTLHNELEF